MKYDALKTILPAAVFTQIDGVINKFNVTTALRLAHFISQCAHESGHFKLTKENLNYSAEGLVKVFPKYFNAKIVMSYARNPEKIANKVYAKRMGNGDEKSGDGYKYRGRGYIQLTGKTNYTKFTEYIGEDCVAEPELIATKYPLASAAFFFNSNGIWSVCDKGKDDATVKAVTKRVNGGTIGLEDRLRLFRQYIGLIA